MLRRSEQLRISFEDFVRARWNPTVRVAWSLTRDAAEAEDLVAEAFARLWPHWPKISQDNPGGYLNRSVVNLYLSGRRRKDVRERLLRLPRGIGAPDPAEDVAVKDELRVALDRLSKQQRLVLVLRYVADMPVEEVAQLLGCSPGSVKTHASRGVHAMRRMLSTFDEGGDHDRGRVGPRVAQQ